MWRGRHRARIAILASILSALLASACGSSSDPAPAPAPAPTPVPTPPPASSFVNMNGAWTGTLTSSNFATRSLSLNVVQSLNCVDGVWSGSPSEWIGAISGVASDTSYTGQVSIEMVFDNKERCSGVADVSGPVTGTDITWRIASFSVFGSCSQSLPRDVVISLHR